MKLLKMRRALAWAAILTCGVWAAGSLTAADNTLIEPAAAKAAPAWKLRDLAGAEVSSADLKGKVVVVDFWATWCGPCVSEIPGYVELQKKYGEKGLVIVGVSVDEAGVERVKKFAAAKKMNYRVVMADDHITDDFGGISAIPTTFVIDREGRIRFQKTGAMPETQFEELLKPLL
jgi:thiol-disulfide isomerase/thioredoxin